MSLQNGTYTHKDTWSTYLWLHVTLAAIHTVGVWLVALIEYYGGIAWLLNFIRSKVKSKRGAEFGIASLVSVADISTANNTISILMAGTLAKDISDEFDVDPRKSASILDIFASCFQGFVPYSPQLIAAAGVAKISPVELMGYSFYPILLGICGLIAIFFKLPKLNNKKKQKTAY